MAHITNLDLKNQLKDTLRGDSNYKNSVNSVNINLVDSIYTTEITSLTFTSGSGTQNFQALQIPANSIIREYGIIITSTSTRDSSTLGFKIGTTVGGTDLATTDADGLQTSNTSVGAGTGSFSVTALTTAANGAASIVATPGSIYRSTGTDVYIQITTNTGGIITGAASAYVTYVKL
jgi:hypothetical protein